MDFNKIKEKGLGYAEKGKNMAIDLTERGKTQAKIVNNQAKLAKAQRQLGALVYSLAKGNEENQPLVDKYIAVIDTLETEITALKASLEHPSAASAPAEDVCACEEVPAEDAAPAEEAAEAEAPKTCPQCGAEVADDALFCNKCGAQL